jgi:SAM-dependent methyltransferase
VPDPATTSSWTIQEGLRQIERIQRYTRIDHATVLEIGSGWEPVIPILFSLKGARQVILTDKYRLCMRSGIQAALQSLRSHEREILARLGYQDDVSRKLAVGSDFEEALHSLGLRYLAPCDCQRLDLPPNSVDIVISRAVLEHIPPPVVGNIFRESLRLLRPGGIVCHIVDNSDHWEHRDKRISRVNFLRFSDGVFKWTCLNPQHFQNRMRHSEYVHMLRGTGFEVLDAEPTVDERSIEVLKTLRLADRFKQFPPDDLAAIGSLILARA